MTEAFLHYLWHHQMLGTGLTMGSLLSFIAPASLTAMQVPTFSTQESPSAASNGLAISRYTYAPPTGSNTITPPTKPTTALFFMSSTSTIAAS